MATFTKNFILTATTGFAANPVGGTGQSALSTAFGVAAYSGSGGFGTMRNASWQAAVKSVGGFGLWRANPNNLGVNHSNVWPTRASYTNNTPDYSQLSPFWLGLKDMNYFGPVIYCMGLGIPDWMDQNNDSAIWGQMGVKIAQKMIADGYNNPNMMFESINEPDGNGVGSSQTATFALALYDALHNAGLNYPVGGPVIANSPANRPGWISDTSSSMGTKMGFVSFHWYTNYHEPSPGFVQHDGIGRINNIVSGSQSYSQITKDARTQAGQGNASNANVKAFLGEYNMYGVAANELDQTTNVGAVYNSLAICEAVKNAHLEYGAIWHIYEDLPNFPEKYGIINASTTDNDTGKGAWFIYPTAWTLGRLYQKMPGSIIDTGANPSSIKISPADGSGLFTLATVVPGTSNFGICLINYNNDGSNFTSAITVNISISTNPSSVTYFEVSGSNPSGLTTSKTSTQLTSLSIPPGSVVILSP